MRIKDLKFLLLGVSVLFSCSKLEETPSGHFEIIEPVGSSYADTVFQVGDSIPIKWIYTGHDSLLYLRFELADYEWDSPEDALSENFFKLEYQDEVVQDKEMVTYLHIPEYYSSSWEEDYTIYERVIKIEVVSEYDAQVYKIKLN